VLALVLLVLLGLLEPALLLVEALDASLPNAAESEPVAPSLADELAGAAAFALLLEPRLSLT
jgi:hypothetical protein